MELKKVKLKVIKTDKKYIYCELPKDLFKGKIPKKVLLSGIEIEY